LRPQTDVAPRLPDPAQLLDRQTPRMDVVRVHDDGDPVVRDGELEVLDPVPLARLGLARLHRTRRVADRRLARTEALEPAARPGRADRDPNAAPRRGDELLRDRLGDRVDRARAVDLDRAAQPALFLPIAPAPRERRRDDERAGRRAAPRDHPLRSRSPRTRARSPET